MIFGTHLDLKRSSAVSAFKVVFENSKSLPKNSTLRGGGFKISSKLSSCCGTRKEPDHRYKQVPRNKHGPRL